MIFQILSKYNKFGLIFVIKRESIAVLTAIPPFNLYLIHTMTNISDIIISAIQDKKGHTIKVMDLSKVDGAPTQQFVICTGNSTTQVSAIADNVREEVQKQAGEKPINYDGYRNSQWIVVDYGDIMLHVFLPDTRSFYRLEQLWSDALSTDIPD